MRINEYNCLDDFINEYDGKCEKGDEFHMGLDFRYRGDWYRMCHEPVDKYYVFTTTKPDDSRIIEGWTHRKSDGWFFDMPDKYVIGIYDTMDELLEATCIAGLPFREVIMDDDTEMLGKD